MLATDGQRANHDTARIARAVAREPIDLSYEPVTRPFFWPAAEAFKLDKVADDVSQQSYYYAANNFSGIVKLRQQLAV